MSKPWDESWVQPVLPTVDAENALAKTRAKLDKATAKRGEIEALLLGDPVAAQVAINQEGGGLYNQQSAAKKWRERLEQQDHMIGHLNLVIEKRAADLEGSKTRDEQARQQGAEAGKVLAEAAAALEGRGETLAVELRELIAAGVKALDAMDAANAALPKSEQLTPPLAVTRLRAVPERITSEREIEVWLDEEEGAAVSEDRLDVSPAFGITLETLRRKRVAKIRGQFTRARLTAVTEITFVPAHRFDLLNPEPPAQEVRHEKVAKSARYEITEQTVGTTSRQREPKAAALHPLHPLARKQAAAAE